MREQIERLGDDLDFNWFTAGAVRLKVFTCAFAFEMLDATNAPSNLTKALERFTSEMFYSSARASMVAVAPVGDRASVRDLIADGMLVPPVPETLFAIEERVM